jgi:hypothetical protein
MLRRLAATLVLLLVSAATAQPPGDFERPKRHFRVPNPAGITPTQARSVYGRIVEQMTAGYALSDLAEAREYRRCTRYNTAPYRSATHGERYVNNDANPAARAYGRFGKAGPMPPGAVLAKDSFTVTADGGVFSGPLFLMEKLPPGTASDWRDWRYVMVMPDGSIFGDSRGDAPEAVRFCADCHDTAGATDGLFFVPPRFRRAPLLELRRGRARHSRTRKAG